MSRHRSISTDISTDTQVAELAEHGPLPLLLYTWAIPHADDWGRMTGDPRQFKLLVCPGLDVTAKDVEQALTRITEAGLWLRYEVAGKWYIAFPPSSWFKHQNYIPKSKRQADKSAYPAPQNPAYRLDAGLECEGEEDAPHIPAHPRISPQIAAERRRAPQNPASPSPSLSPSHIPTVDTSGIDTSRERVAPAASASPTLGALALSAAPAPVQSTKPQTPSRVRANIVPLPSAHQPRAQPAQPARSHRPPDPLWDACVLACDGDGPTNSVERGKWNRGLAALRQSGATPEEIALRAERYRRRYGEGIALNPMSLASNWTVLRQEVTHHADNKQQHTTSAASAAAASSTGRSAGSGRGANRRSALPADNLPDADELRAWARRQQALGVNVSGL